MLPRSICACRGSPQTRHRNDRLKSHTAKSAMGEKVPGTALKQRSLLQAGHYLQASRPDSRHHWVAGCIMPTPSATPLTLITFLLAGPAGLVGIEPRNPRTVIRCLNHNEPPRQWQVACHLLFIWDGNNLAIIVELTAYSLLLASEPSWF